MTAKTHHYWMEKAQEQAVLAEKAGEVPVGAIVVYQDKIVGRGYNQPIQHHNPTLHAEIVAIHDAGLALCNYRLPGTTLYVTLEPCLMCVGAMVHARIKQLVFGAKDPKSGAAGTVLDGFSLPGLNHRVQVAGGVMSDECSAQLKRYFKARRKLG